MGMKKTSQVSAGLSASYAGVSFTLEVGLLVAVAFTALTFLNFAPIVSVLIVVIPLLVLWSLLLSPKAVVKLRLRTRLVLIHLIYLLGCYTLWLSIAHTGFTQYLFWPAVMLGLTLLSIVLVLLSKGKVVPHPREERKALARAERTTIASDARPRGRRAAR